MRQTCRRMATEAESSSFKVSTADGRMRLISHSATRWMLTPMRYFGHIYRTPIVPLRRVAITSPGRRSRNNRSPNGVWRGGFNIIVIQSVFGNALHSFTIYTALPAYSPLMYTKSIPVCTNSVTLFSYTPPNSRHVAPENKNFSQFYIENIYLPHLMIQFVSACVRNTHNLNKKYTSHTHTSCNRHARL